MDDILLMNILLANSSTIDLTPTILDHFQKRQFETMDSVPSCAMPSCAKKLFSQETT
jgi:hypothetical protein